MKNAKSAKILAIFLLLHIYLMLNGCLRSLEKEGIGMSVEVQGTVVENNLGLPARNIRVLVTNGTQQGESTLTNSDGYFHLSITFEQLNEGYWLNLSADSIYKTTNIPLTNIGFGLREYDMHTLYIEGAELPHVVTDEVTGIEQTTAIGGGLVSDDGRSAIRSRGICWSTSSNPTIVNEHTIVYGGTGHFSVALSDLNQGTLYYVRAFAINSKGISYGQETSFSTMSVVPYVVTSAIIEVTQTTVTCGGNVLTDNGQAVTSRGICYSATSIEPTLNDSHTIDGYGMGNYTSTITDLQSATSYYIRAYASNASGTGYGEVKLVTTFE